MKFNLRLGLFDHHVKHCEVLDGKVNITTKYPSFDDKSETRSIAANHFRYNGHIYRIPDNPGNYGFHDLHIRSI